MNVHVRSLGRGLSWRRGLGAAIAIGGLAALVHSAWVGLTGLDPRVFAAGLGGLVAALATALGALPVWFSQRISERSCDALLGFGAGALSGLVEPAGAVGGAAVMTLSTLLLPWGLALAAGAMLFVISHEIIPESHRAGHERFATSGLIVGFVVMMALDTALG